MNEKAKKIEQNAKFSEYLKHIGAMPSENSAVNEGLMGIKPQIWPRISLDSVFRILTYDPGWSSKMMYGTFNLKNVEDKPAKDGDGKGRI